MVAELQGSQAGSTEKGDILITLVPAEIGGGIRIELESAAENEFGRQIRRTIREVLKQAGIQDAVIQAQDKGAMDFAVRARTETAVKRATGREAK